ncbi:hypothetical protein BJ912DRAFT_831475, partial [Pholiota molesta]
RGGTGGQKAYDKLYLERQQKIGTKVTGCGCSLTVKKYHERDTVLGIYKDEHDHPIGNKNLRYTRLSNETREWIASMVRTGVQADCILKILHSDHLEQRSSSPSEVPTAHRNDYATLADVRRIEKLIEAEGIWFDKDDGASVAKWAERLREEDGLLGFKSRRCPVPEGVNLQQNTFILMVQMPWQRARFREHGENLVCIDGTHNTT